jgi:hypothetical protein
MKRVLIIPEDCDEPARETTHRPGPAGLIAQNSAGREVREPDVTSHVKRLW